MKSRYLIILFSVFCCSISAQNSNIRTNKISIFTDGNSFVEKTIELIPVDNEFILKDNLIPKARFGTLLLSDDDDSILSIKSYVDTIRTPNLVSHTNTSMYHDLLKANLNETITITAHEISRTGEIVELVYTIKGSTFSHILLKEELEYNLIKVYDITNISFKSKPIIPLTEVMQSKSWNNDDGRELKLNVVIEFNDSKSKEVNMNYLQKGLSWTPFYYLELDDEDNEAKLILNAEVVNDSEAIEASDLDLFIGEPNFKYSNYLTDLVDYVYLLDPNYDAGMNSQYSSARNVNALASFDEVVVSGQRNQVSPKNYQDYYIYSIEAENLRKNSRAHYKLFETKLDYKHVYICDLLNIDHQINSRKNEDNRVFHNIQFVNTTDNLLGKGAITIIDNTDQTYVPLAQSSLDYTPSGQIGYIEVTESPEIEVLQKEEIIELDDKRTTFLGRGYHKARLRATVIVKNHRKEKTELILRQEVFGELIDQSGAFNIISRREKYYLPNAINKVQWEVFLNPGEEKEIIYEYEYYRQ